MKRKPDMTQRTDKFAGFIALILFLFIVLSFIDVALTSSSVLLAAAAEGKGLFAGKDAPFVIAAAGNLLLVPLSVLSGIVFWTKTRLAVRLIRIYLAAVIAFSLLQVVFSFFPGVTHTSGFSAALMDALLARLVLGIVTPGLLLIYLFAPERKVAMSSSVKPRSD